MKSYKILLFATLTLIFFSSCSKRLTYFTQSLYEDNNWNESELKRIQFYLSEDIELYRTASGGSTSIEDGQELKSGRSVGKEVLLPTEMRNILRVLRMLMLHLW